jgi:hypothetical protein
MPPLMFLPGLAFVWRLIMFTPSTTSRFLIGHDLQHTAALAAILARNDEHVSFFRIGVARRDIR